MKKVLTILALIFTILLSNLPSRAIVKDTLFEKDNLNFECFGHSLGLLSVSYERNFSNVGNVIHFTWRSGIGWLPGYNKSDGLRAYAIGSIPLVLTTYIGRKNSLFTCSVGYTGSFGRMWEDLNSLPPLKFNGYESSFICGIGFRQRIMGEFFYGIYPYCLFGNLATMFGNYSVCFYAGVILNKHSK